MVTNNGMIDFFKGVFENNFPYQTGSLIKLYKYDINSRKQTFIKSDMPM